MKIFFQKHWEKIICGSVMLIFGAIVVICGMQAVNYGRYISGRIDGLSDVPEEKVSPDEESVADRLLKRNFSDILETVKRNIFAKIVKEQPVFEQKKVKADEPLFEVLDIEPKSLDIEYLGRILFADNNVVAQVNFQDRSYIVESGSHLAGYEVVFLDSNNIHLKDKEGEIIKLVYRKKGFGKEMTAQIKETKTNQMQVVTKGSEVFGYKVLDIDKTSVLLSKQGQHLKLQKGKVYSR
ncbi:MAG: hypothetical protein ABII75_03455 [Candidatus Omnitrophota bacterium]